MLIRLNLAVVCGWIRSVGVGVGGNCNCNRADVQIEMQIQSWQRNKETAN